MNSSIKELEDINHLMDFAEEGLNQVNSLLDDLARRRELDKNKLSELQKRADQLKVQLATLEHEKRAIIASHSGFRI